MKRAIIIVAVAVTTSSFACIWDARTMREEKKAHRDLAGIILDAGKRRVVDPSITADIERLKATPQPNDPGWLNDLAGAYIRVGQPEEAVKLLEPAREKFPNDYGVHANLGTAYHMLGRYAEAEKEIARDLEINPDAHFGLEKYHLALLQYLVRDRAYQSRHVYLDEWSEIFFTRIGRGLRGLGREKTEVLEAGGELPLSKEAVEGYIRNPDPGWLRQFPSRKLHDLYMQGLGDAPPPYRFKWDLAADTNVTRGVLYMAELNPDQPAAFVLAGMIATRDRAYNLAVAAFKRAIDLGSPQADLLKRHIEELETYITRSHQHTGRMRWRTVGVFSIVLLPVAYYAIRRRLSQTRSLRMTVSP